MSSTARGSGDREFALLQALSTCGSDARTLAEAAAQCAASLGSDPEDLPFAAIYLLEPAGSHAVLAASTNPGGGGPALPASIPLAAGDRLRFGTALDAPQPIELRLSELAPTEAPAAAGGPADAAVVALVEPHGSERLGLLVAGLGPERGLDERARAWLRLVATSVAGALARARAQERERQLAAALEESERRFARFMNHLPGLAWIKDQDGRYLFVNEQAARAFGRFSEEIVGKRDEEIFPPETAALFRANDARALAGGAGLETIETLEHDDGVHHSLVSKFPIPASPGSTLIGGMAIDVSELKRSERALLEADRRKNEFLATLAHELRSPLAPMRNALEAMRLASAGETAAVAQARTILERQLRQMVRLVDDLLDVSRLSRGKLVLRRERLALASLVASALETVQPTLAASARELEVDLPREPLLLEGDPTRLTQVLVGLLDNAVNCTQAGGRIRLAARVEGRLLELSVTDDGIGIAPDALPRVFEMFAQLEAPRDASPGGLGVGLAIVRSLVALHGGSVEARSDGPGRGACFIVRLPASEGPLAAEAPLEAAPAPPAAAPRRILVVDDNEDAATSLGLMLQMKGNEVRTAPDGHTALGMAEQFRPQLIFLDIGMPGLDGHSVCRRIRARPWGHQLPIVALTGWGQEEDRKRSRQSGFTHHLVKPAEPEQLDRLLAGLEAPDSP